MQHVLYLEKIRLRNFMSFGNNWSEIDLDNSPITRIVGFNLDSDSDERNNGVGKSALVQAVNYAMYGIAIDNCMRIGKLVNNINESEMEVQLWFKYDGERYLVERGQAPNKFNVIHLDGSDNGFDDNTRGVSAGSQEILDKMLPPVKVFSHIIGLSIQAQPFLTLGSKDAKQVIECVLGITQLSEKALEIKQSMDRANDLMKQEGFKLDAIRSANGNLRNTIENTKALQTTFLQNKQNAIINLTGELEQLPQDFNLQAEIEAHNINNQRAAEIQRIQNIRQRHQQISELFKSHEQKAASRVAELENMIASIKLIDTATEMQKINAVLAWDERNRANITNQSKKDNLVTRQQSLVNSKQFIQGNIAQLEQTKESLRMCVCSECGTHLEPDDKHRAKVAQTEQQLVDTIEKLKMIDDEYAKLQTEIDAITFDTLPERPQSQWTVETLNGVISRLATLENELQTLKQSNPYYNDMQTSQAEVDSIVEDPVLHERVFCITNSIEHANQINTKIEQTKVRLQNEIDRQDPYVEQIQNLEASLVVEDTTKYERYNTLFTHYQFMYKLLSDKNSYVRKRVIDQNITYLNERLQYYIEMSGTEHLVQFQSDLTVNINLHGIEYDYFQLSTGQRARVNIALSLAMADAYESFGIVTNFRAFDEILDRGLDPDGIKRFWDIIEENATTNQKNTFVISHRSEIRDKDTSLLVVNKQNRFSMIDC